MNTQVLKKVIDCMDYDEEIVMKFGNEEAMILNKKEIKDEKGDNVLFVLDKDTDKDTLWFKKENKYIDVNSIYYISVRKNSDKRLKEALEKC